MKKLLDQVIDFVLPPHCWNCEAKLNDLKASNKLCKECIEKMLYPQKSSYINGARFVEVECLGIYAMDLKKNIIAAKFSHQESACIVLEELLRIKHVQSPFKFHPDTLFIPISSSPAKIRKRRIDLPYSIAHFLAKENSLPLDCELLTIHPHWEQKKLNKSARSQNIRAEFKSSAQLSQKHLCLVDDIVTTGSTLLAAKKAIQSNMPHVFVSSFCIARTLEKQRT